MRWRTDQLHIESTAIRVQHALRLHILPTITLNEYVHEWPDVLHRTGHWVDGALGKPEAAATSTGSRS
jgi:hypothetical protein